MALIFLENEDINQLIRADVLNRVIDDDNSVKHTAELATIAEMESYLALKFDVKQIFNKQGTDRNSIIVMYAVDIMLYHLHSRINPRQIPALRMERYDAAIKWLTMVSEGKLSPDLPLKGDPNDSGTANITYIGFEKRRNNY